MYLNCTETIDLFLFQFNMRLNVNKAMKAMLMKDESFWLDLLKKYLIDGKYVVVRAVPSIEEQKRMAKEEVNRLEKQRSALGADGLANKATELNEAMASNEIPPPQSMLTQVPIPDITNIKSLPSAMQKRSYSISNGTIDNLEKFPVIAELDLEKFPVHVTACKVDTAFVYVRTKIIIKCKYISAKISHFQFSYRLRSISIRIPLRMSCVRISRCSWIC